MERVLVLGGGLIGCGWAAAFAGAGHETWVVDPDPETGDRLAGVWQAAQPVMAALGTLRDVVAAPRHAPGIADAPTPALVQEALPEDLELKHRVLAELERHIGADVPVASSSSGFTPGAIAEGMAHPERLFIAHPCNPPYLMPTVELVGQAATPPDLLDGAEAIYAGMGKTVLRLNRPVQGHLVNRLQFALWREAVHLVASGTATLAEVERAVSEGLAPRWCLMGPGEVFHLSGAAAGMEGYVKALGPATEALWRDLGTPALDPNTARALVGQMTTTDPRPVARIAQARDRALPEVMRAMAAIRTEFQGEGGDQ